MGLRRALARLAARAPVPAFVAVAGGGRRAADSLRLDPRLQILDSPKPANLLVVVGRLTDDLVPPLQSVHDQVSLPRSVLQWLPGGGVDPLAGLIPDVLTVGPTGDVGDAAVRRHAEVLSGRRPSSPPALPDVEPSPWRGVGPYGQGGKGMTGGHPFGRPLTGRAPDRDGLELDQLPVRVGPFFPGFPPGLSLEVRLQGDVVQEASVAENPFRGSAAGPDVFRRALRDAVPVAELETARARHHLRWLAHALRLHGLPALGLRALALAEAVGPGRAGEVERLRRTLERWRTLAWATAGVGVLNPGTLDRLPAGPVARAAGRGDDARSEDPAYRGLGFEPIVHPEGDARARWRQRLAEAAQGLALAERAGDRRREPGSPVESPRGRLEEDGAPAAALLDVLPELLPGLEWGDAVTTVVGLDLDLEEAAVGAMEPAA